MDKQEIARVNINMLGISGLKCTGMSRFNSNDHFIYYCGQEFLRRNGAALIVKKESEMQYLEAISKTRENHIHFQGKPYNTKVIQVYAPTTNAKEAEGEDIQDFLELTKKMFFSSEGTGIQK